MKIHLAGRYGTNCRLSFCDIDGLIPVKQEQFDFITLMLEKVCDGYDVTRRIVAGNDCVVGAAYSLSSAVAPGAWSMTKCLLEKAGIAFEATFDH